VTANKNRRMYMDNQEQLSATSRAEYIRLARESCARNIGLGNGMNKNHGVKYKENKYENQGLWNQPDIKKLEVPEKGTVLASFHLKAFLIKTTLALAVFLGVFLFDRFEMKISNFSSADIQNLIASNQGIEEAEDFFVSLYEKFAQVGK
jgi:hypothetical protein